MRSFPHFLALCALLLAKPATAQQGPPLLQLSGEFRERLWPSPPSGLRSAPDIRDHLRTLVGLHFGEGRGSFHVDQIGVLLDGKTRASDFCVRIISDDSRYTATNAYRKTLHPTPAPLVETRAADPARLAADFSAEDVVIRILAGSKCGDREGWKLVPAIPPGASGRDKLTAYLNVAGGADAWLTSAGKVIATATCEHARSNIVMYNVICVMSLETLDGARPDALNVRTLEKGATVDTSFPLLWIGD